MIGNGAISNAKYPWFVLTVTSIGVLLVLINYGMINVVLPLVVQQLHAGPVEASWILLSYMLFNTIFILVFGRLADIFGRRKLYLIGFAVFTISSLLAGFSENVWMLIAFRIIQAIGGAIVITNTTALLTDSFPIRELSKGLGVNVLVSSVAQLIGPVVGGLLAESLSWRWTFWFSVPFGIAGIIFGLAIIRPDPDRKQTERMDVIGSVLVLVLLGSLVLSLSEGGVVGWSDPYVLIGFVLCLLLFPTFIWFEKHIPYPLLDLTMFLERSFASAFLAVFLNAVARFSVVLLFALYFQAVAHDSTLSAGLKVLPETIGMLIASPIAGSLTGRYSARLLSSFGLGVTLIGLLILAISIGPAANYWVLAIGMLMTGVGSGLFMTPNTTYIMTHVQPNRRGIANGIRSMLQNMGTVVSTAASLAIITSSLSPSLKQAVYAGTTAQMSEHTVAEFVLGYKAALIVMLLATVCGLVASLLRPGPFVKAKPTVKSVQ
ncbi:MFS transporter [Aneurinibacillus sp. Ricciae_BoGa-3]|uniref:MFS transporter n=1 Tax=Aneurinibacillus sp. Ricciae_BoGa-3 TaxID=3022697 RepID=UPI0023408F2F|nr:MFS transporter [Aneurinibacillus sp. Ricciae_BoGa-3]WCK52674.1 MFS transporter [Aneurinibacillus sp. Ricciae_BoGa-3]